MKIYLILECHTLCKFDIAFLKYILTKLTSVYGLNTKLSRNSQEPGHHGYFTESKIRYHVAAYTLCSEGHAANANCRERNKLHFFKKGLDIELKDKKTVSELQSFCRNISKNLSCLNDEDNAGGNYVCTPFVRFCDLMTDFFSGTIVPDAETSKCCVFIGKSPKSDEEVKQFFGDVVKWNSLPSYRNLCTYLSTEVQSFLWIDINEDEVAKSNFLEHLVPSCKGIHVHMNKIVHPLVPFTTFLHDTIESQNQKKISMQSRSSLKRKNARNGVKNDVYCQLTAIGKLPNVDVIVDNLQLASQAQSRQPERRIPEKLVFLEMIFNGCVCYSSIDLGNGCILKPTEDNAPILMEMNHMLVDKNVSMIFKDEDSTNTYLVQPLHISSGRCLMLHGVYGEVFSSVFVDETQQEGVKKMSSLLTSFPFSILETWQIGGKLSELMETIQKPRMARLEALLTAVRQHDWSRLMQSPCRPYASPPKAMCSPEGPTLAPRSEEELKSHVLELYRGCLHANHPPLQLASSVRHLVATIHRFSRYRNRQRSHENKTWTLSFVDDCLKKDAETIKKEHADGPHADDLNLLLTEFQLQILMGFEVNAIDVDGMETESNPQLVDWVSDIMQTFVMLSPSRQRWREFLHVHLVDAYHSVLGHTLVALFTELGQDPPACLPEDLTAESDKSFVDALDSSLQEEDSEMCREVTMTPPSSPICRRDSLSRPDLGDQASQSSNFIQLTPHKKSETQKPTRKRRSSGSRSYRSRKRSGGASSSLKSPSGKKRRVTSSKDKVKRPIVLSSPLKTPTKSTSMSTLVVKGTPAHRSGQPRWERARKKAAEKSGGRIVIGESPQKPAGREFRRLRRHDSNSQTFEKGEAWKVANEDHETWLSQFVEINGLDVDEDDRENDDNSKDIVVLFSKENSSRDRHSNLFANFQESPKSSTTPFSPPYEASSPVKTSRSTNVMASPTKSILRTPNKEIGAVNLSPVKSLHDRRRVLMSPRVRRRTFSGNEPADAFLDEGTMFLDVNEFTRLSTTPETSASGLFGRQASEQQHGDQWQSPRRRDTAAPADTSIRQSSRVCRRLFATPEKKTEAGHSSDSNALPPVLRKRLVFSKDVKG